MRTDNGDWKYRYDRKTGKPTHKRCHVCDERKGERQYASKSGKEVADVPQRA